MSKARIFVNSPKFHRTLTVFQCPKYQLTRCLQSQSLFIQNNPLFAHNIDGKRFETHHLMAHRDRKTSAAYNDTQRSEWLSTVPLSGAAH